MTSQGKKDKKPFRGRLVRSYITSVISISLVLTLMGAASIFWANSASVAGWVRENMAVSLILEDGVNPEEGMAMADSLSRCGDIRRGDYISSAQGEKELEELLGKDFLSVFETTPVPSSVEVHFNGSALSGENLAAFRQRMTEDWRVAEVSYQENLVQAMNANIRKITLVLSVGIILLLAISFALISNTVRLNVYARRFTIYTMRMVGARKSFIRKPFVRQAILQGAVSGLLASGALAGALFWLRSANPLIFSLFDLRMMAYCLTGTFFAGMAICALSAFFIVGRLAYSPVENLYY